MKNIITVFFISLIAIIPASAQEVGIGYKFDPRTYIYTDYVSDFDKTFPDAMSKQKFSLIREYKQDKDDIQFMIQELILEYATKKQTQNTPDVWGNYSAQTDSLEAINERLKNNLKMVRRDIWQADYLTYNMLEPEMRQQHFRMTVSMAFIVLVALLLSMFFFTIYRKSGKDIYRRLLGSSGLQFVTLFILIIAIILFGILGVIEGTELAAILSGISGYVLGKQINENDQDITGE